MSVAAVPVIALDGPGGTGKGTVGLQLAERWGWHFLDSGMLYRALALLALRQGLSMTAESALAALAETLVFDVVRSGPMAGTALLAGEVVELRSESCATAASRLAALPQVRQALLARQQAWRRPPGLVADGRDMGSVVFPDAGLKIFLTATPEERARRRFRQLESMGISGKLPDLIEAVNQRDARDQDRVQSPMRAAPDAVVIDTTGLSRAAVLQRVVILWEQRGCVQ